MDANLVKKESSESVYAKELAHMSRACVGVTHVRTDELWRTVIATRQTILTSMQESYTEWGCVSGTIPMGQDNVYDLAKVDDNPAPLLLFMEELAEKANDLTEEMKGLHYYVAVGVQEWWTNPLSISMIQQLASLLPSTNYRLVLITPDIPLPEQLSGNIATIDFGHPTFEELEDCATTLIQAVDSDFTKSINLQDVQDICYAGTGMSRDAFELHLSTGLTAQTDKGKSLATVDSLIESVSVGKTDILNSSDLLELYPSEDMKHVGGMENLKEWVSKRANCYSEEAKAHGIEAPKGFVVLGPPGSGKSLIAKSVASELNVPLIRLDFGKVFSSLVGSSEGRMRKALKDVEAMSPAILLADEVDKGLGGIGGGGDSGTSNRVLGSFLTWLNDNTSQVFVVMTANNIDNLPPELLRRGRLDQIFATGLPDESEKLAILKIHLSKRGWSDALSTKESQQVVKHMKGFVGAEIESVVKDALVNSFSSNEDLHAKHLIEASKAVVPLSVSYAKQIQQMTLWAKTHAVPAGKVIEDKVATIARGRRTRKPRIKETLQ